MKPFRNCYDSFAHLILSGLIFSACSSPQTIKHDEVITINKAAIGDTSHLRPDTVKPEIITGAGVDTTTQTETGTHTPLSLIIKNLQSKEAPIIIGVYSAQNRFLDTSDQFKTYRFFPNGNIAFIQIADLAYGEFALAIYQDLNNDGVINTNKLGIPTEPYAFSNNFRPLIKAPKFDNCKFAYTGKPDTLVISLINGFLR